MTKPEIITYRDLDIEIWLDEDVNENPNEMAEPDLKLVHDHRELSVYPELAQAMYHLESEHPLWETHWWFPTKTYIHSGIHLDIGLNGFDEDPGGWDTSHCGYILVSKKEWLTELEALGQAKAYCETWNQYLNEEIYGWVIGDNECWGYYGDDGKEQAILDAKAVVDELIEESNDPKIPIKFKIGKEYHYTEIEDRTEAGDFYMNEIGEDCKIGESFIILDTPDSDNVCSFIMTRYGSGAYYKCIYSDFQKPVS